MSKSRGVPPVAPKRTSLASMANGGSECFQFLSMKFFFLCDFSSLTCLGNFGSLGGSWEKSGFIPYLGPGRRWGPKVEEAEAEESEPERLQEHPNHPHIFSPTGI